MSERDMVAQEEALFRRINGDRASDLERERIAQAEAEAHRREQKQMTRRSIERTLVSVVILTAVFAAVLIAQRIGWMPSIIGIGINTILFGAACIRLGWGVRDIWGCAV